MRFFPEGFEYATYLDGAPTSMWEAQQWEESLAWPIVTVLGFLALRDRHIFLKPNVSKSAA